MRNKLFFSTSMVSKKKPYNHIPSYQIKSKIFHYRLMKIFFLFLTQMSYANHIHIVSQRLFFFHYNTFARKNYYLLLFLALLFFFQFGLHWLNPFSQCLISIHIKSNLTCFIWIRYVDSFFSFICSHLNNLKR